MATISEEEKLRRRQSNEDVLGTHAMEGLFPDSRTLELMELFTQGELTREGLSAAIDSHVRELLAARQQMAGVV